MKNQKKFMTVGIVILLGVVLALFIVNMDDASTDGDHHEDGDSDQMDEEFARGPHGGRLLSKGDFELEITIYEQGIPPQFRVYAFEKEKAVSPDDVKLIIELHRLGGRVDVIRFQKEGEYLRGDKVVEEPHSFDVGVIAEREGETYRWEYSQPEGRVELNPEAIQRAGILTETAGPAKMRAALELPGEIALNADKTAHVVPRLGGIVTEVRKNLGDKVMKDEVIAVIDSRELADIKSEYIESVHHLELSRTSFEREERLWKKKISSEEDYLIRRHSFEEAGIKHQTARQKLITLGLSKSDIESSIRNPERNLARYELKAPFDGLVIEKRVAVGEAIGGDEDIFVIADLSTVWVDITVYAENLNVVKMGQKVAVKSDVLDAETEGVLTYVGALVGEQTRSAKARIVIPNEDGIWRPGLFVNVQVVHEEVTIPLAVKAEAIQTYRDWEVVFMRAGNLFEVRPLELGRRDGEWVEVLDGLSAGTKYVSKNSYILKADLEKTGASHDH